MILARTPKFETMQYIGPRGTTSLLHVKDGLPQGTMHILMGGTHFTAHFHTKTVTFLLRVKSTPYAH